MDLLDRDEEPAKARQSAGMMAGGRGRDGEDRHRDGPPLIVPGGLHADRHYSVFLPCRGRLPAARWSPEFLDGIGIHAWRAEWPPGSLVVLDPGEPVVPPPPTARLLYAVLDPQGETRHRLFDLR